jgi:hypothetical protein
LRISGRSGVVAKAAKGGKNWPQFQWVLRTSMTSGFLKKQPALVPDRERNLATAKKTFRQIPAITTTSPLKT